jgi:hypothetical protein
MSGWLAPELLALLVPLFAMMGWCVYRFVRRGASLVTLRDWLAYLAIALLIVVVIVVAAYKNVRPEAWMQWITPIATAGFAFGIPAKHYWRDVRNPRFLWTLIALLVAHFCILLLRLVALLAAESIAYLRGRTP